MVIISPEATELCTTLVDGIPDAGIQSLINQRSSSLQKNSEPAGRTTAEEEVRMD